jgi:hypothetical protein
MKLRIIIYFIIRNIPLNFKHIQSIFVNYKLYDIIYIY